MMNQSDEQTSSRANWPARIGAVVGTTVFHVTAVLIIFCLTLLPFFGGGRLEGLLTSLESSSFAAAVLPSFGIHIVISALIWGVCYGGWIGWAKRRSAQDAGPERSMALSRGTVIMETLVAFPLLLLMIFGMAQMSVNNSASILAKLATYEAARTVWVWHPERDRFDLSDSDIEDRARVQAAAVLTPVASPQGGTPNSEPFRQMRGSLFAAQWPTGSSDAGMVGQHIADGVADADSELMALLDDTRSFSAALDTSSYPIRSIRKFTGAYLEISVEMLEVEVENDDGDMKPHVGAELTFRHLQRFPMVGRLFGDFASDVDDSSRDNGFYAVYEGSLTLHRQLDAHTGCPPLLVGGCF